MIQEILAAYPLPLLVATSYAGFGLLFALVFITFLVNLMDIHARGGSFGFRIMILPAAMLLWPLIMPITVGKVSLIVRKHLIAKKKEKKKAQKKEDSAALSKSKTDVPIKQATKGKDRNLIDLFPFTVGSSKSSAASKSGKVKTDKPKKTKPNKANAVNAPKALKAPTKPKVAKQGVKNKLVQNNSPATKAKATKQGAKNKAVQDKSPTTKPKAAKRNKKTTQ